MPSPRDRDFSDIGAYLHAVRRNMRWEITARGLGWIFAVALLLTCIAVPFAHTWRFSDDAVRAARLLLFGGTGLAIAWMLVRPLLRRRDKHPNTRGALLLGLTTPFGGLPSRLPPAG